jgi:hypothetical protein
MFMKNSLIQFYQRSPKTFAFFLAFLLLLIRIWERFLFPGLWAEDGFLFLREAIMYGPSGFFQPYAGYFHTIPRLIAYFTYLFFPVVLYPYVIMLICTGLYAFAVSRFAGEEFSDLIASVGTRLLLTLSLCLVPGLYEVLGNLANLHWILFFYLCVISIRSISNQSNPLELIFIFLICASTGEPIVLIPVLGLRLLLSFRSKNKKAILNNGLILFFVISFSILNFSQRQGQPPGKASTPEEILIATNFTWNQYLVFQPILGDKKVAKFYDGYRTIYRYLGLILGIGLLAWTFRKKYYFENFFFPVMLSVFLVPILTWIVRPGSLLSYINIYGVWEARYSFILSPWGLAFWVIIINHISKEKFRLWIVTIFFLLYFGNASYRFLLKPYNKAVDWFEVSKPATQAMKSGCPNPVKVLIHPVLTSPITGEETKFYFGFEFENKPHCD